MAFVRTAFWRSDDDRALQRNFWRKFKRVAARVPFAEELLAAYYCAFDKDTPLSVKVTLVAGNIRPAHREAARSAMAWL